MQTIQINDTKGMLSKVPEVTIFFWIIKVLCTTVGETASDFLNMNLGFGLTGTSIVTGVILVIVIFFQFRAKKYIPALYWLTVVLISIFGTLVTDNLTDEMGISLEISTAVFSVALILTFIVWYVFDRTLSIHSILTRRRESFYWIAILFTFALGTASGDLMAEKLGLGYMLTGIIIFAVIVIVTVAWRFKLDAVLAFWIVYIMTRPLGASLGDYLSQSQSNGGLGLGATLTSAIFIAAILIIVIILALTKLDIISDSSAKAMPETKGAHVFYQTAVVVAILVIAGGTGYYLRHESIKNEAITSSSPASPLGDLSGFRKIAEDTLTLVRAGNLSEAKSRVGDLEYDWDNAESHLKTMNPEKWTEVDKAIDKALRKLRAVSQDPAACIASLESLINIIDTLDIRK